MSNKIYFFSGAGLSAESGIPTFRDSGGLWEKYDVDEVCNIKKFYDNYEIAHTFYNEMRELIGTVSYNEMHCFIKNIQHFLGKDRVKNITTNVDDLFEKVKIQDTVYLHGKLREVVDITTKQVTDIGYEHHQYKKDTSKTVKPNVIFFGEIAPEYETLSDIVLSEMKDGDIIIFIGMSFNVIPPSFCIPVSRKVTTININNDESTNYAWDFTYTINKPATEALVDLEKVLRNAIS